MTSILDTVVPKSDQLNFDDFIGGQSKTIQIIKVRKVGGEQPVIIDYVNDNGKPWKPNKSMRRVMIRCWGDDIETWAGKWVTLFGNPKVRWAGKDEGGIQISHLSDIKQEITMALTETRGNRKPFTVRPLAVESTPTTAISADDMIKSIEAATDLDGLKAVFSSSQKLFKDSKDFARIHEAKEKRKAELSNVHKNA